MTKVCLLEALAHTQILRCRAGHSRQCSPTSEMGRCGAARGQSAPLLSELGCGQGTVPTGPVCAPISSSVEMGRST